MFSVTSESPLANLAKVMDHHRPSGRAERDKGVDAHHKDLQQPRFKERAPAVYYKRVEKQSSATSLSLTTQDGDKVAIELRTKEVSREVARVRPGFSVLSFSERFSERFDVRFEGHIDEDERAAIKSIMDTVFEEAEAFFGGRDDVDVDSLLAAGHSASDEIANFSLKLRQESVLHEKYGVRGSGHRISERIESSDAFRYRFEALAESSKRLVAQAEEHVEPPSAVTLVQATLAKSLDAIHAELQLKQAGESDVLVTKPSDKPQPSTPNPRRNLSPSRSPNQR